MLTQSFETYWAYFIQSDGQLFDNECRTAASLFLDAFDELSKEDPGVLDSVASGKHAYLRAIIDPIRKWASREDRYPYMRGLRGRFTLFEFLTCLKCRLIHDLGLRRSPRWAMTSDVILHSERVLRWSAHLPHASLFEDPDAVVQAASESETIAVVGDIRRSQDLMTYCTSPGDFSTKMVSFIEHTRKLIEKHSGFFDKFTGDGFVAYFNRTICERSDLDYRECFLSFAREELEFSAKHFQEWSRTIEKLPTTDIGLAIGADLGVVAFHDMDHHLVAVGKPIVWAARMASAGHANELLVNNLLYAAIEENDDLSFEMRESITKAGEPFVARSVKIL